MSSGIDERLWNQLADLAESYIVSKERTSDLRGRYLDVMSENKWANRNFENLVTLTYESLDVLERKLARQGDRDEDWFPDAIVLMVDGHFANSVLSNKAVSDELTQREYDGMMAALDDFKDMTERGGRRGRGREERTAGGFGGSSRDTSRDRGGREVGRPASTGGRISRTSRPAQAAVGDHWAHIGDLGNDAAPEPQRTREVEQDRRYAPEIEIERAVQSQPSAPKEFHIDGPDYTKARPHDRFWRGGEQWELAHLSKWKLTGDGVDLETAVPTLYDCNAFIKYYVMDAEGNVREEFVEVTDDTRYAAHEILNRSDDQPVAVKPASSGFSRQQLVQGTDGADLERPFVPNARAKMVDLIDEIDAELMQLRNSQPIDSLHGATFNTRARMSAEKQTARVDLHLLRTPIVTTNFDQIDLIEQIYNTNSLAGAQEKLNELKPKFDLPVWETLNQRFSDFLLRALRYQFQYNEVLKLNFSKSYDKLLGKLTQDRGAEFTAQFAQRAGYITDLATGHFAKADVAGYTEDLFEHELYRAQNIEVPVVAFVDFVAMTAFNCTLDQLGIGRQLENAETGVVINATENRELNDSLRKLYQTLDKACPAPAKVRVYLSTSDNRLIEVLPYANRTDVFILAAV